VKRLGADTEDVDSHSTVLILGSTRQNRWRKLRPDALPTQIATQLRDFIARENEARKRAGP
jgi:hypothetical protein